MTARRSLFAGTLVLVGTAQAIQLNMLDEFEVGVMMCTTDGWTNGAPSTTPATAVLSCGEKGSCCLVAGSAGGFGPGSRQSSYNEAQWTGDYVVAGVNKIQLQAANSSATETLHLRIGVSNGNSCYVSTTPAVLAPNTPGPGGLMPLSFVLDPTTMSSVSGNLCTNPGQDSLQTVLSNVTQLRILSAASAQWSGDAVISELQIDAIQSANDADLDGVNDDIDNCTNVVNADQRDSDGDNYGNLCDADLDNDCIVNPIDLGMLKAVFFTSDADADFNGDGLVNVQDLGIMKSLFAAPPGPGLGACGACEAPAALGTNADFAGLPMFMRGGLVLDWGADPNVNEFSDQTGGQYVARFEVNPGSFEWKIADEAWSIEYCTTTNLLQNTPTNAPLFGCVFPNGTIDIPSAGCYEFQMQTDGNVPPNSVDVTFTPASPP